MNFQTILLNNKKAILFGFVKFSLVLSLFCFSIISNFYEEILTSSLFPKEEWLDGLVRNSKSLSGVGIFYVIPIFLILFSGRVTEVLLTDLKNNFEGGKKVATIKETSYIPMYIRKANKFFKGINKAKKKDSKNISIWNDNNFNFKNVYR